jgi:hypothetical protein
VYQEHVELGLSVPQLRLDGQFLATCSIQPEEFERVSLAIVEEEELVDSGLALGRGTPPKGTFPNGMIMGW